jgi:hypothetical protein
MDAATYEFGEYLRNLQAHRWKVVAQGFGWRFYCPSCEVQW